MGKSGIEEKKYFWQRRKSKNTSQTNDLLPKSDAENGTVVKGSAAPGEFVPPDGGWGWVVCVASMWANGTVMGIINTFGIIYVQMRDQYSESDSEVSLKTAFVGSTCTGVTFLMCIVASILSDRVGIRPTALTGAVLALAGLLSSAFIEKLEYLYLTYGVILGLGSALVYSPSLVILGHYFKKHMGLVNGIVSFGSSIFTIALTRILPYLLETIGIKYVFVFLAGLQSIMFFLALTWRPLIKKHDHLAMTLSTESVYQHCNDCCSWTRRFLNVKIWRNKSYVIWVFSLVIALFGYFVPFFHLPKHTIDTFPGEDGGWLILCLSITSGVSRIAVGKVADIPWVSRIKMQQFAFVILGAATLCIPFSSTFGGLIAISLVMGVCDGTFVCLLGPIAFDIVGPGEASQALGFLLGLFSIPFTIGPPVAGWLYDVMGDYKVAFHVAGAPPIIGALLMFLIPKVQQSYPAVTETMEFASISMVDVYNEVRVPKEKRATPTKTGGPSGPSAELEFIHSNELLFLGDGKPRYITRPEKPTPNHNGFDEITIEVKATPDNPELTEKTPMLKADNDQDNIDTDQNQNHADVETKPENSEEVIKAKTGKEIHGSAEKVSADVKDTAIDVEDEPDASSTNSVPDVSTSLLEEVGKYFDANQVKFDSDQLTTL